MDLKSDKEWGVYGSLKYLPTEILITKRKSNFTTLSLASPTFTKWSKSSSLVLSSWLLCPFNFLAFEYNKQSVWEFPGGPVVKTLRFHCWGYRTKFLQAAHCSLKKKINKSFSFISSSWGHNTKDFFSNVHYSSLTNPP